MTIKQFLLVFLSLVALTCGGIFFLYTKDIPATDTDVIRIYQITKLNHARNIETIIVGDSAAGNAIDAALFSELSQTSVLNLALVGGEQSFGAAYNMIRHATRTQPLENVIIMESLDGWRNPFMKQGFFNTLPDWDLGEVGRELFTRKEWMEYTLQAFFNPKYILRSLVNARRSIIAPLRPIEHDYLAQNVATYANGKVILPPGAALFTEPVPPSRIEMLQIIGRFCRDASLHCIYVHGPLHEALVQNSSSQINTIQKALDAISGIIVVHRIFSYSADTMGDAPEHILFRRKQDVTRDYFAVIKDYMR